MNNLGINFHADLAGVVNDLPSCLTFDGVTIDCTAGDEQLITDIDEQGTYKVYEREATVSLNAFNPMPESRETMTLDGIKYYAESISKHPQAESVTYQLRRRDGS